MYPEKMARVRIAMTRSALGPVLAGLHESGSLQIIGDPEDHQDATIIELNDILSRTARLIDLLDVKEAGSGLKAVLSPPPPPPKEAIRERSTDEVISEVTTALGRVEPATLELTDRKAALEEERSRIEEEISVLGMMKVLGLGGSTDAERDFHRIVVASIGSASQAKGEDGGRKARKVAKASHAAAYEGADRIREALKGLKEVHSVTGVHEGGAVALVMLHPSREKEVYEALDTAGAVRHEVPATRGRTFSNHMELRRRRSDEIEDQQEEIDRDLASLSEKHRPGLLVWEEVVDIQMARERAVAAATDSEFHVAIDGWVTRRGLKHLKKVVERSSGGEACVLEIEPERSEEEPIALRNPGPIAPFEALTKMYSMPRYNEIDPTLVMALGFTLFFGLMLGDAGYGLMIVGLSLFGLLRLGKHDPTIRRFSILGLELGISTTFFGILFGSFFGDLIQRGLGWSSLYSINLMGYALPYDPIRDPIIIMKVSLLLGLGYLYLGIILAAVQSVNDRAYKDLVVKRISWLLMVPSGTIIILSGFLGSSFPEVLVSASTVMAAIGFVLILVDAKMFFLFEITGFLGDVLSFMRIVALGLATAGIAFALNQFVQIIGQLLGPVGLFTIGLIILIIGHVINMALQALGAGIHSLRLQFVEFLKRFYEGGGEAFTPFRSERQFTIIEPYEENRRKLA